MYKCLLKSLLSLLLGIYPAVEFQSHIPYFNFFLGIAKLFSKNMQFWMCNKHWMLILTLQILQDFICPATRYYPCLGMTLLLPYVTCLDCQSRPCLLWHLCGSYIPQNGTILFKLVFSIDCNLPKEKSTLFHLYTRSLEFQSNACVLSHFCHVWLFVTPWTIACQAPLSVASLQARILEWVAMPFSMGSFWPRDWTRVSYYLLHWQVDH